MRQPIYSLIFFLSILSLPLHVFAQPSNDDCTDAISLTVEGFCTTAYTNIDATNAAPNGGGGCGSQNQTVWFSFVATQAAHVIFLNNFDTDFDPTFRVYSGGCGALSDIACSSTVADGGDETATVTGLTIGDTYLIRVNGRQASDEGTFCMYVLSTAPSNDDCGDAIEITPNTNCTNGTNINATATGVNGASCGDDSQTVWYKFTAVEADNFIYVANHTGSAIDYALYNSAGGGTCIGGLIDCEDATATGGEQDTYTLTPGNIYYIRVSGTTASDEGLFCVQVKDRPPNDLCTNAVPLSLDATCTTGTTIFSTNSADPASACGNNATGTVWYSFTPISTTNYTLRLTQLFDISQRDASFVGNDIYAADLTMEIYDTNTNTCAGTFNSITCTNDVTLGEDEVQTASLTAGTTYFIKITGGTSTVFVGGVPTLPIHQADFCLEVNSAPVNDDCTNATLLIVNNSCQEGTTYASSTSGVEPASSCGTALNTSQTVWYKFVATSVEQEVSITNLRNIAGTSDLGFDVFHSTDGTCTTVGASFTCQNGLADGGTETQLLTSLTIGDTYYIRVSGFEGVDATDFCIKVLSPPLNDLCSGVIPLTMNFSCVGGTTIDATTLTGSAAGLTSCGVENAVVWYSFVATQTSHSISFINQSAGENLVFSIFGSSDNTCSGVFTEETCRNARGSGVGEETTVMGLTVGNTYYILVGGATTSDEGNFCISVSHANDLCTDAVPLAINAQCIAGGNNGSSTTGATDGTCGLFDGARQTTVWYSFVATTPSVTVQVEPENGFDPEFTVFSATGSCTGFSEEACIDNGGDGGLEQGTVGSLTIGNTYYVMVDGYLGDEGEFCISVTSEIPCGSNPSPGNTCDAAPLINNLDGYCGITSNSYTQDSYNGLQDFEIVGCAGMTIENNSFLKFTAGSPVITFEFNISTSAPQGGATCDQGIQMQIFSVTGNDCTTGVWENVTDGGCINPSGVAGSTGTLTATGLITGQVYYVMFDGFAGDECGYALRVPKGNGVILPVELTSFTGKNLADVNRLTWTTVSEIEVNVFEVERSHNGMQFETIGKVIAKGNSQNLETYNFNDIEPIKGINYYRLKMVDNDTTVNYSQTIDINNQGGGNDAQLFTFYPNPSIDFINYTVYSPERSEYKFEFIDIQGKVIKWETKTLEQGNNFIQNQEVVTLADGLYILKVTGLYGSEILHHKFIKR